MSTRDAKGRSRFTFEDLGSRPANRDLGDQTATKQLLEQRCGGEQATARLKEGLEKAVQSLLEEVRTRFISEVRAAQQNDRLLLQVLAGKENRAQERPAIEALAELVRFLGKSKIRGERQLEQAANREVSEYELSIQQLEARIREQIGMEQQLRLYVEDAKERILDLERKNRRATDVEFELSRQNARLKQRLEALEKDLRKKEDRPDPLHKTTAHTAPRKPDPAAANRPPTRLLAAPSPNHFHFNFSKKHLRDQDRDLKALRETNWFEQPPVKKPLTLASRSGLTDASSFSALLKKVTSAL